MLSALDTSAELQPSDKVLSAQARKMASQEVLDLIHEALIAHQIGAVRGQNDVTPELEDLRFEAEIFDREQRDSTLWLVVEIYIFSPLLGPRPVIESFVGMGETRQQATFQAFDKFLVGVFHVLIEGLAKHVCQNMQAEIEFWHRSDASWKVYSGPVIAHTVTECTLNRTYPTFYAQLEKLFSTTVRSGSHFARVFVASHGGQLVGNEVLLDNETWPEAQELLVSWDWQHGERYQTLRQVILALPEDRPVTASRWEQFGKKFCGADCS